MRDAGAWGALEEWTVPSGIIVQILRPILVPHAADAFFPSSPPSLVLAAGLTWSR